MTDQSQFKLLGQRRFAPFFVTQFLGALNDNVFRNGLVILVTFQGVLVLNMNHSQLANVAGALFILPYFLFSATAGQIADKYEKSMLMRRVKLLEIVLMTIAAGALWTEQYTVLLLVLFLMGCQSTLFGPVKYAYLPQQLVDEPMNSSAAMRSVEAGTYTAIILGMIIGGVAVAIDPTKHALLAFALVALGGSRLPRQPPDTHNTCGRPGRCGSAWNAWKETWRIVGFAREDRTVFLSILGISWFWFYGSAMTLQVPAYTLDILQR